MNHALYIISVLLHVLAAITWVGGMLFLSLVFVPLMRKPDTRELAVTAFHLAARRFRVVGNAAIAILILTGIGNVVFRYGTEAPLTAAFWTTPYGSLLAHKLGLVAILLVLGIVHDLFLGPKALTAMREHPDAPATQKLRTRVSWMARINLVLALAVVTLGVMLLRGTPW